MAINLSLSKLPWYGQIGIFLAVSLVAVGAFWNWYVRDASSSIESRSAQLATLQLEVSRGQATAARLPEFRREVNQLETQLSQLRNVLPEEQDVADLLRRVQAMATQSRLRILGFTPTAVARREMHAEWPIGLRLEGTYHDLGMFFDRVSKFPRIINIGDIRIRAAEAADGGTITAEFTATTFVLIDSAARPAGAAPAAQTE